MQARLATRGLGFGTLECFQQHRDVSYDIRLWLSAVYVLSNPDFLSNCQVNISYIFKCSNS